MTNFSNTRALASVNERDMDFLFLEELTVDENLCRIFASKVYKYPSYEKSIGTWHSVSDAGLGESDLIHLYLDQTIQTRAILIENKIDAPEAESQGERYKMRGKKGIADGSWSDFRTCIIAPKKYLESKAANSVYHGSIQYEEVFNYFKARIIVDKRYQHKAYVTEQAVLQSRRGTQSIPHPIVSKYVHDYIEFARQHFPELLVEQYKPRPPTNDWVYFNCVKSSSSARIVHQNFGGALSIMFHNENDKLDELKAKYDSQLPNLSVYVTKTGTPVLTMPVQPIITKTSVFAAHTEQVRGYLNTLTKMVELVRSNRDI